MTILSRESLQKSRWMLMLRASENIYFTPAIPYKKLQGAMSYLPQGIHPDDVLMLIDDTVFGSAKAGLCLTATGLFYKASFEDEQAFLFEHIRHVETDLGIITNSILINGQDELSFTQLDKGVVRTLAEFLNESCQATQLNSSDSMMFPPEAKTILSLYAYYLTYRSGQWDNDSRDIMLHRFSTEQTSEQEKQYIAQLTHTVPNFNYRKLLDQLWQFRDQLPYDLRMQTIDELVVLMLASRIEHEQVRHFIVDLCRSFNISQQLLQSKFDLYFKRASAAAHGSGDMTIKEVEACKLLEIQPEVLSEQTLQQAYRQKMADFHPDKYQTLPESVRQFIEQQAQQLNQARAVLKAYLGV
ncbi:J domain-containing protein [Acinetobacter calcoaceticus]|uniref:DnaJ-domain-containing protein 1 n=1 Tax=Acinetobacter calcoaceticus TaxID=471 RepID=A0ABD5AN44_ACICA|nr:J domain-containing protein [Acinetobacter calcoaceticus]MDP9803162.1 DnaJ-domain-containing protein 1 [Acinetobacter calcoaceticus]